MTLSVRGIVPACSVTFDADGRFDEAGYRRYLQWSTIMRPPLLPVSEAAAEVVRAALKAAGLS